MTTTHLLDARRLLCPLPVIRTQDQVGKLPPGDLLKVTCTDPGSLEDIPAWCRIHGHRLVTTERDGPDITFLIEVGASAP